MNEHQPFVYTEETLATPPDAAETMQIIHRVAHRIIASTAFGFIHPEKGLKTSQTEPLTLDYQLQSGFLDWKYWNGVNHLAFDRLSKELQAPDLRDYSLKCYQFGFDHLPFFKKLYEAEVDRCAFHQYFRLDRLDDFGAIVGGLIRTQVHTPEDRFLEKIEQCAHYIENEQDRLEDGTFCRNRFGYTSLWADDLFMSLAFLIHYYQMTQKETYLEDAIHQVKQFHHHLWNASLELFHHSKIVQEELLSAAFWGRANGWAAMAQAMLLDAIPEDHEDKKALIHLLKKQLVGLSRYQGKDGLWHQLLNRPDSFEESSSTAMFAFALAKAVNEGWISEIYTSIAVSAWNGLKKYVDEKGNLDKVSLGFNIKQDLPFYLNQPIEPGGDHGLGAFLLCANEIRKLKPFRDCVWC